eukprot:CAMPEP_0182451576 /NCGR_PEP_ID=MMETSP1172-20130603/43793_1 /TAXON_ID=708627 /ORGANISM="Timspurckia oligopyrenoides, Strain CCMP3278" /LENGTH=325 /DNA_ID=CAMNT_0024649359 /DNA_START=163 /DNA_END=1140 /DNA_ORIENTATION=+
MPNLTPPIRTVSEAFLYRARILNALSPENASFEPLMTLYLTDHTTPQIVKEAAESGFIRAFKLYPFGATTNSSYGVTDLNGLHDAFHAMEQYNLVLCIHAEIADPELDMLHREDAFISTHLNTLLTSFPALKIVVEHCTTKSTVDFISNYYTTHSIQGSPRLVGSITPHHLLFNTMKLFEHGKLQPDHFCLPILKSEFDRKGILQVVTHDTHGLFFAGTDSAPHLVASKSNQSGHGCAAGIFCAPNAVEFYAQAFDSMNQLNHLEAFLSQNGAKFYGLSINPQQKKLKLSRKPTQVMDVLEIPELSDSIRPLYAGQYIPWSVSPL